MSAGNMLLKQTVAESDVKKAEKDWVLRNVCKIIWFVNLNQIENLFFFLLQ